MTATLARAQKKFPTPGSAQIAASNPTASVWVNASAGSGKTTVLTRRVTRLLLNGTAPEKLLCLTFTRAGAAEMTNRITALFSKWVSCSEDELRRDFDELQGQAPTDQQLTNARRLFARILACPGGLRIRTIHAFCQEILSRFPIEAGLSPHFNLIEGQELDALKAEILNDLLRDAAQNPGAPLAQDLALLVGEVSEGNFEDLLQDALRACSHLDGDLNTYAAKLRAHLTLAPDDNEETFVRRAMADIPVDGLRLLAERLAGEAKTFAARGHQLARIAALPLDARVAEFDSYCGEFLTQQLEPRAKILSATAAKKYPDSVELANNEILRLRLTLERIEAVRTAALTDAILRFSHAFAARLNARKAARGALDYDDLINTTERLLARDNINAWILYKLDNGIDHVLVDEAQDTSRAQWNIVRALTTDFFAGDGAQPDKNRTLFVVGDEKQSIFSFQNADPESFFSMRDFFARKLSDVGSELAEIGQHTSFRSAPAILRAVDAVFAQNAARTGVSRDPVAHQAAKPRGEAKLGRVEIWPLLESAKETKDDGGDWIMPTVYEEERDPQVELAQRIARKIRVWLDERRILPGMATPIKPADIMILLRRRGRFADLMVRALKSIDVPVTGIDRMHLIRELPVLDLLAALRFVLLPEDDLNLASLLRSPLLGLEEEQLMSLALGRGKNSLWQSLSEHAHDPAFAATHAYLSDRLAEADFTTPFTFLSRLLALPCPASADSGRKALWQRLGAEALDPIEELVNAAQDFSRGHPPSLQNFLRWLTDGDSEIKRELDNGKKTDAEDQGLVRIMTVHASKGLEAPIVFLPDTTALPRATDLPKFQWIDADTPVFFARKPQIAAGLTALWQQARRKQLEEYRRLFYVALTRAANRLYICGWKAERNSGDESQSWYRLAASALQPLNDEHAPPESDNDDFAPSLVHIDEALAPPPQAAPSTPPSAPPALPDWARNAAAHTNRPPRAAPPSASLDDSSAATPDIAFARGRIIHRLLQSLPDLPASRRPSAIARFLSQPRHNLDDTQQADIATQVERLLQDPAFAALFGADSRAEVALTGALDGVEVFRQVDRLCLRGDEVWIVDYKTNRPPPKREADIPAAYRVQMAEYRTLLSGIYPDHKVRCFLLWTYAPDLMEVT